MLAAMIAPYGILALFISLVVFAYTFRYGQSPRKVFAVFPTVTAIAFTLYGNVMVIIVPTLLP